MKPDLIIFNSIITVIRLDKYFDYTGINLVICSYYRIKNSLFHNIG